MTPYQAAGHANRREYLSHLSREMDVPLQAVIALADLLGPNEDFDGLVNALQDYGETT